MSSAIGRAWFTMRKPRTLWRLTIRRAGFRQRDICFLRARLLGLAPVARACVETRHSAPALNGASAALEEGDARHTCRFHRCTNIRLGNSLMKRARALAKNTHEALRIEFIVPIEVMPAECNHASHEGGYDAQNNICSSRPLRGGYHMDYETKPFAKPEQVMLPPQRRPNGQAMTPHIKMFVSDWFTDELGNKARIIKARD